MKIENIQKWAPIAEVISGLAVIATLVILVIELRSNTSSIQAQTYQALTSELNEVRRALASPEINQLEWGAMQNGLDSLDQQDRYLLFNLRIGAWAVYESAYFAFRKNALGGSEWARFQNAICRRFRIESEAWEGPGRIKDSLTPEFAAYIEQQCN